MDKSTLTELYNVIENGELWNASCAVEALKNQAQSGGVADFIWELENAIDNLRGEWKDKILDLQEAIDQ